MHRSIFSALRLAKISGIRRIMTSSRPSYTYTPLNSGQQTIRILTLQPGCGSDPLVGSLTVERLDSKPEYEAISYVWGIGGRQSELACDGAALATTQSIHDALSRVRHASRPRRLWADQICINQDDLAERSQQVKLMNAVYKNAKRVLVWLGRDDEGVAADAVRMVHRLQGLFADEQAHKLFRIEHTKKLARQSNKPWIPLSKLTRLPWFHRIWIVQEIGTEAPATLFWGSAEVDWESLSAVAAILSQSYHHLRLRFHIGTPSIRYLHRRFVEPDVAYDQNHNRGSFVYELHRARHLLAQDARDHVYAFLGHFSLPRGGRFLADLAADYTRPVDDVYVDVAVRDLRGCQSLIMLSAVCRPGGKTAVGLPSWVPDWREPPVHMIGNPETPHRAAGDTVPDLTIDEGARVLHIRGVHVDTIRRRSWAFHGVPFHFEQRGEPTHLSPLESLWQNTCLLPLSSLILSHPYPPTSSSSSPSSSTSSPSPDSSDPSCSPTESALFALLQTLTNACIGSDRSRPYPSIPPSEWLSNGAAYLLRSSASSRACPALRALARTGDPYQWTREATLVTRGRRFAVTASRGYFLLGPDGLQEGDSVVVLHGGRTLFVLRRREGSGWMLVGECYVHGLMGGEALGGLGEVFSIS